MSYLNGRVAPVVIGAALVVGCLNVAAYATNGHPLLLGQRNGESKTALVSNLGKGPALSLKSGKKSPALAVSNSTLVKSLNADKVDGLDGKSLQNNVVRYVVPANAAMPVAFSLQGVRNGRYMASFNVGASTSTTDPLQCILGDEANRVQVADFGASGGGFAVASGVGIFTKHAGQAALFLCDQADATLLSAEFVSTVTLTPIDHLARGTRGPASRTAVGRSPLTH